MAYTRSRPTAELPASRPTDESSYTALCHTCNVCSQPKVASVVYNAKTGETVQTYDASKTHKRKHQITTLAQQVCDGLGFRLKLHKRKTLRVTTWGLTFYVVFFFPKSGCGERAGDIGGEAQGDAYKGADAI